MKMKKMIIASGLAMLAGVAFATGAGLITVTSTLKNVNKIMLSNTINYPGQFQKVISPFTNGVQLSAAPLIVNGN